MKSDFPFNRQEVMPANPTLCLLSTKPVSEDQPVSEDWPVSEDGNQNTIKYSSTIPIRKFETIKKGVVTAENQHRQHRWVQLAGHQDSFAVGEQGTILKKLQCNEKNALEKLMSDALCPYVPQYNGIVNVEDISYIEMQDLLQEFSDPCVMDCKMGTRTYLEEELLKLEKNPEPRKDMYEKMVKVDPLEPSPEEHALQAVTKPRYMQWRERISSTETLGFRIEGIKNCQGEAFVDFKNCKDKSTVSLSLSQFTGLDENIIRQYIQRLKDLRNTFNQSDFFSTHEIIGSSLLFVHDKTKASVWMIDFGKTMPLENGQTLSHTLPWIRGNHEDGYLTGVNNIIDILEGILH